MDVSNPKKVRQYRSARYFTAWQNYDIELLRYIFTPDAKYVIRNRKRVYYGIEDIIEYWLRNKNRQRDLRVHWHIVKSSARTEVTEFVAFFQDIEKWEVAKVHGQIIFEYNAQNKIALLTEAYRKSVRVMTGSKQDTPIQILETV